MADVIELVRAFKALGSSAPTQSGPLRYQAIAVPPHGSVSLAKTAAGEAALLIHTTAAQEAVPPPLRLEHLTVQHGIAGVVHTAQGKQQGTYSLVVLKGADGNLVEMFLRFAMAFANQLSAGPTPAEVAVLIQRLVALLQHLRKPNTKVIQGLWAELFVISTRRDPGRWVAGWHVDPMGLHDFMLGDLRVEVKSSATGERVHRFSHKQLCPPTGTEFYLASVLVERMAEGMSVFDVAEDLHRGLTPEQSLILDSGIAAALGSDHSKASEHRFDRSRAMDSLLFFPIAAIPRLGVDVPPGVTDVSYTVRVADIEGVSDLHFE